MELREALDVVRGILNQQKALRRLEEFLDVASSVVNLESEVVAKRDSLVKERDEFIAMVEREKSSLAEELAAARNRNAVELSELDRVLDDRVQYNSVKMKELDHEYNAKKSLLMAQANELSEAIAALKSERDGVAELRDELKREYNDLQERIRSMVK